MSRLVIRYTACKPSEHKYTVQTSEDGFEYLECELCKNITVERRKNEKVNGS